MPAPIKKSPSNQLIEGALFTNAGHNHAHTVGQFNTHNAGQTTFEHLATDFSAKVPITAPAAASSFAFGRSEVFFTANEDLSYLYHFAYSWSDSSVPDPQNTPNTGNQQVALQLVDVTDNQLVLQRNVGWANGIFFDTQDGTGGLVKDHDYRLTSTHEISNRIIGGDYVAQGEAYISFSSVPEPTSLIMFGLGMGLVQVRRSRKMASDRIR